MENNSKQKTEELKQEIEKLIKELDLNHDTLSNVKEILKDDKRLKNIGSKKYPVTSLSEFMTAIHHSRNKLKIENKNKDNNSTPIGKDFFLYRGTASDKFDIVGRIAWDIKNLRVNESPRMTSENIEKQLFNSFKQRARIYQKVLPNDDWEWLALARHHGVPTRILDWSRDPQIALWFATQDEKAYMHEHSVVHVFQPTKHFKIQHGGNVFKTTDDIKNSRYINLVSPFDIDKKQYKRNVILYRPSSLNLRIDFQSSWFTVHPFYYKNDKDYGYRKLDSEYSNYQSEKIYIDNEFKASIRRELAEIGIDSASIYKDMDNLGKYLRDSKFRHNDEIFTDEMMMADKINYTFHQLQGIIGLYNSIEVESIKFVNFKGLYYKLSEILIDKDDPVISVKTYNNINREYIGYRNEREIFLKLLENKFSKNELDYQRIQFYNARSNYFLEHFLDDNINVYKNESYFEFCSRKLFDYIMVWSDGLSKNHIQKCYKKNLNTNKEYNTRYLLVNIKNEMPGYCVIETEKKFYLSLEFNHEYLGNVIGLSQNMIFFLEFKPNEVIKNSYAEKRNSKVEKPIIIDSYLAKFDFAYNLELQNLDSISDNLCKVQVGNEIDFDQTISKIQPQINIGYETARNLISNKRIEILNQHNKYYYLIKFYGWSNKENENERYTNNTTIKTNKDMKTTYFQIEDEILIPVFDNENRASEIQAFLDYIFNKMRTKHPLAILRTYSYGKDKDWYLSDTFRGNDVLFECGKKSKTFFDIDSEPKIFYYPPYFYFGKISDEIKPNTTLYFCYGEQFLKRCLTENKSHHEYIDM